MVTSLASFRSDWTIVHIPGGNFLEARPQLYVNISLMRLGCSGRGALTLQQPRYDNRSDAFIQSDASNYFPVILQKDGLYSYIAFQTRPWTMTFLQILSWR
jgi:hypothetical protein